MGPTRGHDGQDVVVEDVWKFVEVFFEVAAIPALAHLDDVNTSRRRDAGQSLFDDRILGKKQVVQCVSRIVAFTIKIFDMIIYLHGSYQFYWLDSSTV